MKEPGFYWVRRHFFYPAEWSIGEKLTNGMWQVIGFEEIFNESEMAEIGKRVTR